MSIDMQHQGSRDIVSRVKAILMTPKTEWPVIAAETTTIADLYKNYVIILAAIPAVARFIKMSIIGIAFFRHVPIGTAADDGGHDLCAFARRRLHHRPDHRCARADIRQREGPDAGAEDRGLFDTAYWVASVSQIIPALGVLIVLAGAIYSLYLLYLGLPFTMKTPADKACRTRPSSWSAPSSSCFCSIRGLPA